MNLKSITYKIMVSIFVILLSLNPGCRKKPVLPTITLSEITEITESTAMGNAEITDDGNSEIVLRGICWDTVTNPDINSSLINTSTAGSGSFNCKLISLSPNTTYYVRAYAVNEIGVGYSNSVSFSTSEGIPQISTNDITNLKSNAATCGGNIISDCGSDIINRGVCWSTNQNPTINDNKTIDGSEIGTYQSEITNLSANTTYFVRAYATNELGTAYGAEKTFTTPYFHIGQSYQGGIIAYIDESGQHGFIATQFDLLITPWSTGEAIQTGANGHDIGTGQMNTNTIVQALGSGNYAAKQCYDLVQNGYDDWYLPSYGELKELFKNQGKIGNFSASKYWSSTEDDKDEAWRRSFDPHVLNGIPDYKTEELRVRAIRNF